MAKSSSRKLWAMKLAGNLPNSANSSYIQSGRKKVEGVILGIDPSLRGTGLAVLEVRSGQHRLLKSLTVTMKSKATMPECLAEIYKSVSILIEDFNPNFVALEQTIFVQNVKTAQILGAARGAAIAAAAIIGLSRKPKNGNRRPAATGIPAVLYPKAKTRFCLMLRIVWRLSLIAVIASIRSLFITNRMSSIV